MDLAAFLSGGKDSAYAILKEMEEGNKIRCLISVSSRNEESYMFHTQNIEMMPLFAAASDLPLIIQESEGVKEEELRDLETAIERALKDYEFEGIVSGAIESNYQRRRMEKICDNFNLRLCSPLWNRDPETILKEISERMEAIIIHVAAYGLDKGFLGRKIDKNMIEKLKKLNDLYKLHLCGEGGEYETFVVDAPYFKRKIRIKEWDIDWRGDRGSFIIRDAELIEKIV